MVAQAEYRDKTQNGGIILMERYQLSLPGPTECDPEVLNVLNCPNLPHYGALWIDFFIGK